MFEDQISGIEADD